MPVSFSIDSKLGVILLHARGVLRDEDLIGAFRGLNSDPCFGQDLRLLGDFSGITENHLTSQGISRCAQLNPFREGARQAVVVRGAAEFGMFRMYEAYCSINQKAAPQIFKQCAEAVDYLNKGVSPSFHLSLETPAPKQDCSFVELHGSNTTMLRHAELQG